MEENTGFDDVIDTGESGDSGANDGANDGLSGANNGDGGDSDAKSYTENDLKAAIEAERQKWQQEADEAAELAKLSKAERDKKLFERERDKLAKDRAAFERERLIAETGKQLREKGLPDVFAATLTGETAAATLENINAFAADWGKALEQSVNDRLKSKPPRTPQGGGDSGAADDFLKGFESN